MQEIERNAASMATSCTNSAYRTQENERNAASMATSYANPAYRRQEQIADTNPRRMTRQTNPPEIRAQENERNAASMATSCTNPAYRQQEQIADTIKEDRQESNRFFMTWQLSLILQIAHTYIISLAGYGMKNVVMGVGTCICQVQQVPQKRYVVQMVLCLLLVTTLMKN
jgi:hypothetical protein